MNAQPEAGYVPATRARSRALFLVARRPASARWHHAHFLTAPPLARSALKLFVGGVAFTTTEGERPGPAAAARRG